ncbi:MAG: hypothetical protein EBR82_50810 [Caulobacteraceae bacterium]|nr:hypothetical protein [Caulobacteraceae bacterium]
MHALLSVGVVLWTHLFDPALLLSEIDESGPTWTLAAGCSLFLGALAWAIRQSVSLAQQGIATLYSEVIKPLAISHDQLLRTLSETRRTDSETLISMRDHIAEMRQKRETHDQKI